MSDTLFDNNRCSTKGCHGGGLAIGLATSITGQTIITDSVFTSNIADGGSAILSFRSTTVIGGRFIGNSCGSLQCGAGALAVVGSLSDGISLNVLGVQFVGNNASNSGTGIAGAIYFAGNGAGHINNSLFARNQAAEQGAAIFLNWGNNTTVLNSTIADVVSNPQSAIAVYAGSTLHITNTIIASRTLGILNKNGTVTENYNLFFNTISTTSGVTSGGHSLIGNPKFVDPLYGDYRLQFGSAAIDHGIDAGVYTDLDGNPRPIGAGFDIGAYEYTAAIYHTYLPIVLK